MVVARRPEARWRLAAALDVPARATCAPDLAASRLAHPSGARPDAVLLLVAEPRDAVWLRRLSARTGRSAVRVVALVTDAALVPAARAAGAAMVVPPTPTPSPATIRTALERVTRPAPVIDIGTVRSA